MYNSRALLFQNIHQAVHGCLESVERYGMDLAPELGLEGDVCVLPLDSITIAHPEQQVVGWPQLHSTLNPFERFFQPLMMQNRTANGRLFREMGCPKVITTLHRSAVNSYYADVDGLLDIVGFIGGVHLAHLAINALETAQINGDPRPRLEVKCQGIYVTIKQLEQLALDGLILNHSHSHDLDVYDPRYPTPIAPIPRNTFGMTGDLDMLLTEGPVMGLSNLWVRQVAGAMWGAWNHFRDGDYELALGVAQKIKSSDLAYAVQQYITKIGKLA
jgi:hypothetical protein